MSPVMDLPPAAEIGHNSRAFEIGKTVAEVRALYLQANASNPAIGYRLQIIHTALVSDMSDAEFRVLFAYLMHGNREGTNISVGQARVGMLIGKCERQVRQATKNLEADGWLASQKHRQKDATRAGGIPAKAMEAILSEIVDRQLSAGQGIVVPLVPKAPVVDRRNPVDRQLSAGLELPKTAGQEPKTGGIPSSRPAEFRNITIEDKPYPRASAGNAPTPARDTTSERKISGKDFWARALNPMQAAAHEDISRDDATGDIRVTSNMRQKLENILKGRASLDIALSMVKGKISPDARGMWLANRVESVLAEWVLEQEQRDSRAAVRGQATPVKTVGNIPPRGDNCPDDVWQVRLKSYVQKGLATQAQAESLGLIS